MSQSKYETRIGGPAVPCTPLSRFDSGAHGVTRPTSTSTISRARCIRRLICRLLTVGLCLRFVERFFGFSVDCFGAFFCLLAHRLSGFLGLSSYLLRSLFGFFADCFRGFLGLFACGFKSVFNRLPCFFCSLFYVLDCSFLRERSKGRSRDQRNNKACYFHECLLYLLSPVQVQRTKRPHCVHPVQ